MALNPLYPALDGISPSWSDVAVRVTPAGAALVDLRDIKSINTGLGLEVGEQRGASGGRVMARTTGSEKSEASMTLYYSGYQKFLRNLKALAPLRGNQRALGLVHFGINYMYTPLGSTDIFEIRIKGCRYAGRDINGSEGVDAQTVDVKLSVIQVVDMIDGEECGLL